jgi:class 3 adenylate cyclase/alpha-beta hydrolase superfamily lysophospholipase
LRDDAAVEVPDVQYAISDGHRIAWQQWGSGPDLLVVPPFISNVELIWEQELFRRALEYFGDHVRVTVFDKRGMGLSDRFGIAATLEELCADLLAVMDAAGLEHAAIQGFSEGGLMGQLFTVLHPSRVERLVLGNSNPGAAATEAVLCDPDGSRVRYYEWQANFARVMQTWGTDSQFFVDLFNPCQSGNDAFVRWTGRYCRQSATVADVFAHFASFAGLDAADRLAEIAVPTLITHDVGDRVAPFAGSEWLATQIVGAIFKEMPGSDHFGLANPDWRLLADVQLEFICGSISAPRTERRFATVVFTDIVSSTKRTAHEGDESWRHTLDSHDRIAWATAARHAGTIVSTTGDGVVVRFEGPSQALAFARDFRREVESVGVPTRCGMHTGEIEVRADGDITGYAVNLAARVQQAADPGAIFVSSTVRDLLRGSDTQFEDRGEHSLKGFDSPWRLYALAD